MSSESAESTNTNSFRLFDYLIKVVPVLTAIFIFFGAVKNIFFYNLFGINIIEYIDTTEFLKLFIKDILLFFLVPVYIFAIGYNLFINDFKRTEEVLKPKPKDIVVYKPQNYFVTKRDKIRDNRFINITRFIQLFLTRVLLAVWEFVKLYLFFGIIYGVQTFVYSFNNAGLASMVIVLYAVYLFKILSFKKIYKAISPNITDSTCRKFDLFSLLVLLLIINTFFTSYINFYQLRKYEEFRNVSITFQDSTTIPAYSYKYCYGMTDKFLFVYNDSTWESLVYKRSEVKALSYRHKLKPPALDSMSNTITNYVVKYQNWILFIALGIFTLLLICELFYKNYQRRKLKKEQTESQ